MTGRAPYPWYPSLNLNDFPPHAAAGEWGPQQAVDPVVAPTTTREVTVTTAAQFATEATNGTRVLVNITNGDDLQAIRSVSDLDIVLLNGSHVGVINLGTYSASCTLARVRVHGETLGTYSGGDCKRVEFLANHASDYHVDGIGLHDVGGCIETNFFNGVGEESEHIVNRMAVTNNRVHSEQSCALIYANHCVIAGNSTSTGNDPSTTPGSDESWCWRVRGSPMLLYGNDMRGTKFHRARMSGRTLRGTSEYGWLVNNTMVDLHEARIAQFPLNSTDVVPFNDPLTAVWISGNRIYAEAGTGETTPSLDAQYVANYARVTGNTCWGDFTQSIFNTAATACTATDKDFVTGNVFNTLNVALPAWGAAGDPRGLSLPFSAGYVVAPNPVRPQGSLTATATWSTTPGCDGYVIFLSYRDRGSLSDESLYPSRYIVTGQATNSLLITNLPSGAMYGRVAPYTGSTVGALGAQFTLTPA